MDTSKRNYALIAGISLLVMGIAAAFSFGYAHGSLFPAGDRNEIKTNLNTYGNLFIAEITGWIIILLCDILVAWAFYHYFTEVQKNISLGTALLRILYAAILGIAISQLFIILNISKVTIELTTSATVLSHLESFEKIWSLGLIVFGIHLLGLGYLSIRSSVIPSIWGWLLLFAGVCYFVIHLAKNSLPTYETQIAAVEMIVSLPMAVAEIGFAIWLLIRGRKVVPVKI